MTTATKLVTMADLIDYGGEKWLAEAVRILRVVHTDHEVLVSRNGALWRYSRPAPLSIRGRHASNVPIPPIPYPESAGLHWLQGQASMQGWGGSDFEWVRYYPLSATIANTGKWFQWCTWTDGNPINPCNYRADCERRDLALPNGQPAYVYAGQCPRCSVIYWGV